MQTRRQELEKLIVRSENRIERTSEIIKQCVNIMDNITTEYSSQLKHLQESRDELLLQNKELLRLLHEEQRHNSLLSEKFNEVVDKMLLTSKLGGNNINVN